MKKIKAEIIADSKNEFGDRITTFVLTFPRFILAELNTHRAFSRNSASSRAIPFRKMVEMVENDPFIPIKWMKEHKGMQGSEYLTGDFEINEAKATWLIARDKAIHEAKNLSRIEVTKQICNRLLEPFLWHTAIVTATEFENFFELRCPQYEFIWDHTETKIYKSRKDLIADGAPYLKDKVNDDLFWLKLNKGQGEIHISLLAEAMWDAMNESTPKQLKAGEWHIPFGDNLNNDQVSELYYEVINQDLPYPVISSLIETKIKIATARCARVSYMTFDGEIDYEKDIKLHDQLLESGHFSPFEHCAKAMSEEDYGWSGNFRGFVQYRKILENYDSF